jgi:hypothetical protein
MDAKTDEQLETCDPSVRAARISTLASGFLTCLPRKNSHPNRADHPSERVGVHRDGKDKTGLRSVRFFRCLSF